MTHKRLSLCALLCLLLLACAGTACAAYDYSDYPDRSVYIADPAKMPLVWADEWQPEEWMLSLEGKIASLTAADSERIFTGAHRADAEHYPENSIEAIISVWAMGGDMVEIDLRVTKDGKLVLLHDDTLNRMTNFNEMKGKNGLPTSSYVFKWTYEQLQQLNLREGNGGALAAVTPFKIATLEEVLTVCKDRLFIVPDKCEFWRYVPIDSIMPHSIKNYLYNAMEETGNYTSILISYGTLGTQEDMTLSAAQALEIQRYIYEHSGEAPYLYLRGWTTRGTAGPYAGQLAEESLTNAAVLVNGAYEPENADKNSDIRALTEKYTNVMFGAWTIDEETDNMAVWQQMYDDGLRAIFTNHVLDLVRFAAEKK